MEISPPIKTASYNAVQIANEFIKRGVEDGIKDMTNMKIQKLVYFAQGFYLAIYDRPLIQEDFVVMKHGPVVRQLYKKFRDVIDLQGWGVKHRFNSPLSDQDDLYVETDDNDAISVINSVWDVFKNYSASDLRSMTHRYGSPWSVVFDKEGLRARIPHEEMTTYFKKLMDAN